MNVELEPELEEKFRKKALEKFGYKRTDGALQKGVNEAIETWVSNNWCET